MTEYEVGDTFESRDGQQHYQIQAVERSYKVTLKPANGGDDPGAVETITYPGNTLARKIERGDLQPVGTEEPEDAEEHECPAAGCEDTFSSPQGAKSHFSQVHDDSERESVGGE